MVDPVATSDFSSVPQANNIQTTADSNLSDAADTSVGNYATSISSPPAVETFLGNQSTMNIPDSSLFTDSSNQVSQSEVIPTMSDPSNSNLLDTSSEVN